MSVWLFVKTFGDLCLYFSVISAFPKVFAYDFHFLWPILLGAVSVAMGDMLSAWGKPKLRFLCLALPAAGFFLANGTIEYLILLPAVVYPTILVIRDLNDLDYYSFRGQFKACIIGWVLYFFMICLLAYFEDATQPWKETMEFRRSLQCGLLYFLSGVLLLRQLRMGQEYSRSIRNTAQMVGILGATGGILLGLVALERILQNYASSVLDILKKAFLYILTAPLTILTQVISWTLAQEFHQVEQLVELDPVQYTEPPVEGALPPPVLGAVVQGVEEDRFPWWFVALMLVVMLAVMVLLARAYQKKQRPVGLVEEVIHDAPPPKKRENRERSNRWKLRQIYRNFLRHQRSQGMVLHKHYTSADVLNKLPKDANQAAAARLRALYLAARYDPNHEVTAEQVNWAKEAMKQIRNGKEISR